MIPEDHFPLPAPTFLVYTYPLLISSLHLVSDLLSVNQHAVPCIPLPPSFLIFNINASALATLEGNNRDIPLICTLFPHFQGTRTRVRDVCQSLNLNPVKFWYMTGQTPGTLEAVIEKNMWRSDCTQTLGMNTTNRKETPLHS